MKGFLKEPLLHFVLLGAALFAADALLGERTARAGDDEINVSRGRIENLAGLYAKTWQRAPTEEELRELIDDFVLEEALYREGLALGVDKNDTVIRRRVRQKMEFVASDIMQQVEPTEADLEQWLAARPEAYARPGRYRFRQLFLSPERHGEQLAADARRVLGELQALPRDADPRGLGDASLIEHAFADISVQGVIATFGEGFAEDLAKLPSGEWGGPLESAFGLHLVFIDERSPGEPRELGEVRDEVARDWAFARREEAARLFRERILARYRLVIEWPEDLDAPGSTRLP